MTTYVQPNLNGILVGGFKPKPQNIKTVNCHSLVFPNVVLAYKVDQDPIEAVLEALWTYIKK